MKLATEPNLVSGGTCLAARYEFIGRPADTDPAGRRSNYAIPYTVGVAQEIVALDRSREMRALGRNSQLASQSLVDIWQRDLHLPMFAAASARPSTIDQIVIFGGWRRWANLQEVDKGIKEDALWRATPRGAWELVWRDLFRGMEGQIHADPKAILNSASTNETGGRFEEGVSRQRMRQEQMTVPDLSWYYEEGETDMNRYLTGGNDWHRR